jgi:hypothetical protein
MRLPFGRLWYGEPNAINNAIGSKLYHYPRGEWDLSRTTAVSFARRGERFATPNTAEIADLLCRNVMHSPRLAGVTSETVREGFEPSVPFWGTAL